MSNTTIHSVALVQKELLTILHILYPDAQEHKHWLPWKIAHVVVTCMSDSPNRLSLMGFTRYYPSNLFGVRKGFETILGHMAHTCPNMSRYRI